MQKFEHPLTYPRPEVSSERAVLLGQNSVTSSYGAWLLRIAFTMSAPVMVPYELHGWTRGGSSQDFI